MMIFMYMALVMPTQTASFLFQGWNYEDMDIKNIVLQGIQLVFVAYKQHNIVSVCSFYIYIFVEIFCICGLVLILYVF